MKKLFILTLLVSGVLCIEVNAQIKDTFDSNTGWTEYSDKEARAVIEDGVLNLIGKYKFDDIKGRLSFVTSTNYSPLDVTDDFEIKCDAIIKKVDEDGEFGMLINHLDDGNFIAFTISRYEGYYYAEMIRYEKDEKVGYKVNNIKLPRGSNKALELSVKQINNRLQFYINGIQALEVRHLILDYTGVGFYIAGKQNVQIDNLEYIQ